MPTTKLPDNGHSASQKIGLQHIMPLGPQGAEVPISEAADVDMSGLHRQIHDVLDGAAFKRDAAGKSGEALRMAVAAAIATEKVLVEIISVGLADAAEAYASTPYEAVWETSPGSAQERSYFGV